MFGDRTDGSKIIEEASQPYWLRPDLLAKYRRRKGERGELSSVEDSSSALPEVDNSYQPSGDSGISEFTPAELLAETELENSWGWVKQRRKQSKFRELTLKNFDGTCCLTGVRDRDLLVAAHIVRWSDDAEFRLRPENGLLLYHEYDLLFENGYFYFNDDYKVCLAEWTVTCSPLVCDRLRQIEGQSIRDKAKWRPTGLQYLQRHRQRVSKLSSPAE